MNALRRIPATLWHLLLVTLLGLPLTTPLWMVSAVACTHDGHLHVHRIAAMVHGWQNGVFFSRWVPDLAYGYGYPFFVYREPAPLFLPMGPHLAGLPLPAASNLFYAVTILACGWFMYLWVRDVMGERAGLVSAVAYMAAPYILLDALVRGNSPESLALPLFPLLLWVGRRWLLSGKALPFLATALGLAFLSLSHNISTMIFVPTLLVYLLVLGWSKRMDWKMSLGRVLLVFTLGLGMTFFYTGGALLELDQVSLQQSTNSRNNDFHFNFASWSEILAPVRAEDPNLLNPPLPIRLGWVPALLALLGATSLLWRKELRELGAKDEPSEHGEAESPTPTNPSHRTLLTEQRLHILLMLIGTAVYLFFALPESLPLWENIPLIDFVQFPWRFIGRAALPVAFLAGAPFTAETPTRFTFTLRRVGMLLAIALLMLEAIPLLYPRTCTEELYPTILNVQNYEHTTGLVGVDPEGLYFKKTVEKRPKSSPLEADYQAGRTPQRFDQSVLPEGASAEVSYDKFSATVQIDSPVPFSARYLSFAFPGWAATIDGAPVEIVPSDPDGLITFNVPAGQHELTIRWQSTPLRTTLSILSLLALAGAAGVALWLWRKKQGDPVPTPCEQQADSCLPPAEYWLLLALAIGLIGFKLLIVDNVETPFRHSGPLSVEKTAALQAAELRLDGYSLSSPTAAAGSLFEIDMAWSAVADPLARYQTNVWLADENGLLWSDKETQRPRIYEDAPPTIEWQAGQWAWDSREINVLPGTPPGDYRLIMTLFDQLTLQPLTLTGLDGTPVGTSAEIGTITIAGSSASAEIKPQFPANDALPDAGLILRGSNQDRSEAAPGDPFLLTLFWERTAETISDAISLQLVDANGTVVHTWQLPVIRDRFQDDAWPIGETLRAQHPLRLPANLASGDYHWVVDGSLPLDPFTVTAPDRLLENPAKGTPVNASFGDQIQLQSVDISPGDSGISVDLVWSTAGDIASSYRIFVHLIDGSGAILAQSDGEPAAWSRPTTGWIPGEYIIDSHSLPLPADLPNAAALRLRIGLYDPATGQRLSTESGDAVLVDFAQ